jgi:hypothetical protein
MSSTPTRPAAQEQTRGATASGAGGHSRHLVGNALRAVRVFGETAFSVVVLGHYDAQPATAAVPRPRADDRDAA